MKKIFILIGGLDIGGTEKQLLLKLKNLNQKFNFTLILFSKKGELYSNFLKEGINIIDISSRSRFFLIKIFDILFSLYKIYKKEKPTVVNLYLPHSYIISGLFAYIFPNIKFIMTRRSLNFYQKKIPFVRFFESKILHKKMKYILVNSKAIKKQLLELENVPDEQIKLIYNSVKIKKNIIKNEKEKRIKILCLANLLPYKNHMLIIEACRIIRNENFLIYFVGRGKDEYVKKLKNLINKYKLEEKIVFCGQLRNYEEIAKKCSIGILSSDEEGFSNSILEYMTFMLPVLATNVGGTPEIVIHGRNGYIVEKGDYKSFAYYLKKLILTKSLREKLGNNSFKTVNKAFDVTKNIKKYENFYNSILK